MNRKLFRLFPLAAVLTISAFFTGNGRAQSGGPQHTTPQGTDNSAAPKTAEQQFKNIQVLKGIPAEQLFPTMQFISASLGVECEFCHVPKEFEKDDKKTKQTARKMMEMMFAINRDNFEGHREVTCNTCHRGNADPVAIPAVMTAEEEERIEGDHPAAKEEEAKENAGPTGEQLIDKYVQALGGASAVNNVSTRVMKGKIEFGGKSFPIDIYCKHPEQRVSYTHNPEGESVTAFNGHEGWMQNPKMPLREMRGNDLDGAGIDADLHLATDLKQMFTQTRVRGTEKVGDREAYVVVGRREGKTPIRLYFDKDSGLLVRLIRYGDTALGWIPTQIDYADYREVKGLKVPYRWTLSRPSGRFTIEVSNVTQNVPVDDAKFVKPPSPPQDAPKAAAK